MKTMIRTLTTTRDVLEGIDSVLSCVGVAVTAGPLQANEMRGAYEIIRWTGQRLSDCSEELEGVIDQLSSAPN
jgi:hypothetical protein